MEARKNTINELARKLAASVPGDAAVLRSDLERNFSSLLRSAFERMDLVTREEFDVQRKVAEAVHNHPIAKKELQDKWNIFVLSSSQLPQYEFLGRGKPPKSIDQWKVMTVRALGSVHGAMERALEKTAPSLAKSSMAADVGLA